MFKRLSDWHQWPFFVFYFPISYAWIGNYIKSRSFWYFTSSNPTLTFGGFEGEGKKEMYDLLPPQYCPQSLFIDPSASFSYVVQQVQQQQMQYPFIVKPDVGMKGILFRKIENEQQLHIYHHHMPATYIIQEFIDMPLEVSVFYCRLPHSAKGSITAMIQKDFLSVKGNGYTTLEELVINNADTKRWLAKIKKLHGPKLKTVLADGESFCLSHIGNLYNGATFKNLCQHIDPSLVGLFDRISYNTRFYYGRYDIKCTSVEDLKQGKNFCILEFNGAGSVPNHIHTGSYTLLEAYKEIRKHWKALYDISRYNHKNGFPHWNLLKGYRFLQRSRKHFKKLKALDKKLLLHEVK